MLRDVLVVGGELDLQQLGRATRSYAGEGYLGYAPESLKLETVQFAFYGFLDRDDAFSGFGRSIAVFRPVPFTVRAWAGPSFSSTGVGYNSGISASGSVRVTEGQLISLNGTLKANASDFTGATSGRGGGEIVYQWRDFNIAAKVDAPVSNLAAYQVGSWVSYAL